MRFRILLAVSLLTAATIPVLGQVEPQNGEKPGDTQVQIDLSKEQKDGIQVAEAAIVVYSGLRGRAGLSQIRKTTVEIGKTTYFQPDGKKRIAEYEKRIIRGNSFGDEKIRLDQKFPNASYAMVFDGGKIFGVLSNSDTVFTPREDAEREFRNRFVHGLEALLRYKENGSSVELERSDKLMGVDFYVVNLTDDQDRVTTFFISKKSFRVLIVRYKDGGIDYQRKYYNHNYAQGTLVPYRSVLKADGKEVEETTIATITFGQLVEESLFSFEKV